MCDKDDNPYLDCIVDGNMILGKHWTLAAANERTAYRIKEIIEDAYDLGRRDATDKIREALGFDPVSGWRD